MFNSKTLLCTSILLGSSFAYAEQQAPTNYLHLDKSTNLSELQHAIHEKDSNHDGFIPPRQMSPHQFEQLLQSKSSFEHQPRKVAKVESFSFANSLKVASVASAAGVESGCTSPDDLLGLTGEALVSQVKSGDLYDCMYGLFDTRFVGTSVFSDESLLTIANAINDMFNNDYDGGNAVLASQLENLVIYLRAMHWAEYSAGSNRAFQPAYLASVDMAFMGYFNSHDFVTFTGDATRDYMVRYELLTLASNSNFDATPYLARFSEALLGYANTVSRSDDWGVYYEENGVTQLLTHLYNSVAYDGANFEQAAIADPTIVANFIKFVEEDGLWLLGHTREYQWNDAVKEIARLLQFTGPVADSVRPSVQAILETYSHEGVGGTGWLNAQSMVTNYDSANCEMYGDACSFDLEAVILSGRHTCNDNITIRYQGVIEASNLTQICDTLATQDAKFHTMFGTNAAMPVANDYNSNLEVVVFSSYTDYDNYAGTFFNGMPTNNGGIFLEGDPWVEGNQARFVAHQATWLPNFSVWNLEHEYIHYLDGRFNKWGNYDEQPANSVWWAEGLAEYLSQPNDNASALAQAELGTYDLSELFQTTYQNSNTERTYYWGYLAVRFMMENQRSVIDGELLPHFRAAKRVVSTEECTFDWSWQTKSDAIANGWSWAYDDSEWSSGSWVWTCGQPQPENTEVAPFTPYNDILDGWGVSFDSEFNTWLACIVAGNGICEQTPANPADLDGNGAIDKRDISLFMQMLRQGGDIPLMYDFNNDNQVNMLDVRALMSQCDDRYCRVPV